MFYGNIAFFLYLLEFCVGNTGTFARIKGCSKLVENTPQLNVTQLGQFEEAPLCVSSVCVWRWPNGDGIDSVLYCLMNRYKAVRECLCVCHYACLSALRCLWKQGEPFLQIHFTRELLSFLFRYAPRRTLLMKNSLEEWRTARLSTFLPLPWRSRHPEFYIQRVIENDCLIHASRASSDRGRTSTLVSRAVSWVTALLQASGLILLWYDTRNHISKALPLSYYPRLK